MRFTNAIGEYCKGDNAIRNFVGIVLRLTNGTLRFTLKLIPYMTLMFVLSEQNKAWCWTMALVDSAGVSSCPCLIL